MYRLGENINLIESDAMLKLMPAKAPDWITLSPQILVWVRKGVIMTIWTTTVVTTAEGSNQKSLLSFLFQYRKTTRDLN